jgi:uncharacterized surface protein with fasciclin (FAS1) repeats
MSRIQDVLDSQTQEPFVFNNLITLLKAAGLEYLLQGNRPLTIFAPIDAAFDDLGSEVVYDLLKDVEKLTLLLKYHVVPLLLTTTEIRNLCEEEQYAGGFIAEQASLQLPTDINQTLTVELVDENLHVNNVPVLRPNIMADNGVIHCIGAILWPAGLKREDFGTRSATTTMRTTA